MTDHPTTTDEIMRLALSFAHARTDRQADAARNAIASRLSALHTELERTRTENAERRQTNTALTLALDVAEAELERTRAALERIKGAVCGERNPRWTDDWATTNTRGWIADTCDAALGSPDANTRRTE